MRGRIQKALAVMAAVAVTVTSAGVASVDAQAATVKPKKLTVTSSVSSKVIDVMRAAYNMRCPFFKKQKRYIQVK